jgi:outer membrane receptor for ferrienterochelin and colicins
VPALRFDMDSQFGNNLAPKAALRFAPSSLFTARISYGAGFRAPSFKELLLLFENSGAGYVVQGNPGLRPETSQSVNFGMDITPATWLILTANAYRNDLVNLIQPLSTQAASAGGPQRFTYGNIAAAYTQGVELALRVRVDNKVSIEAGYTLTDSMDLNEKRALEGRARHRGNFAVTLRHPAAGLEFTTRVSLVGPRPYYTDDNGDGKTETTEAEMYALCDARIGFSFTKKIQAFVGAQNLLNVGDPRFLAIPPRTAFVGLSGNFEVK